MAGLEVLFFRRILEQLGFLQRLPTMLLEDNQACIYMSRREGQINRAKHIDTRIHKLRELCARVCFMYCHDFQYYTFYVVVSYLSRFLSCL